MKESRHKQFADLAPADFERHPAWVQCHTIDYDEPWYDETDEETFRPWDGELPVNPEEAIFLVRARYTLPDKTSFPGFVTPLVHRVDPHVTEYSLVQPTMFLGSGAKIGFWEGMFPHLESRVRLYSQLRKSVDEIFPIEFKAEAGLAVGAYAGQIQGFYTRLKGGGGKVER